MDDLKREHFQFLPLIFRPNPMIQLFNKFVKNRREATNQATGGALSKK